MAPAGVCGEFTCSALDSVTSLGALIASDRVLLGVRVATDPGLAIYIIDTAQQILLNQLVIVY